MTNYEEFLELAEEMLTEFGVTAEIEVAGVVLAVLAAVPYTESINPMAPGFAGPTKLYSLVRGDVSVVPQTGGTLTIADQVYTIGLVRPYRANDDLESKVVAYEFELAA
jgi:hypothetical protein